MSKPLLLCFFLVILLLFVNLRCHASNSSAICPSYDCGNGLVIKYPFRRVNNTPPDAYCGYQDLALQCSDHGQPILILPNYGYAFYVEGIDYEDSSLHLVDYDTVNQTCPKALHNVPLGVLPFRHSPLNLNLTFYYNCSLHPSDDDVPPIGCLTSGINESYVFVTGDERSDGFEWSRSCKEEIVVTVMKDEIKNRSSNGLISGFPEAMDKGFVLDWHTTKNCLECEASGGLCGYNYVMREVLCFCEDGNVRINHCRGQSRTKLSNMSIGFIAAAIGVLAICVICCLVSRHFGMITGNDHDMEAFIRDQGPLALKRYRFSEVKKMTESFKLKLGEGGYGSVYKGQMPNGNPVAVKVLKASKGNGEEFINEVVSISRTSHVNIVTLLGFCLEGKKKALIYEFMPNGSLEKFIHDKGSETTQSLSWENLHQIAVGIARGLEYLHRGCNTRILHFDIKPNNILLDQNFRPKISDFGLAKLCPRRESIISMLDARGTIGYIAPEVWHRNFGGVSHKSDVYSYGMMILDMVGGRKNVNVEVSDTSQKYFPDWVYSQIEMGSDIAMDGAWTSEEDEEIAKKMMSVGLWCIQTIPSERPSMTRVIEMLEGSIGYLQTPPKPLLVAPINTATESPTISLHLFNSQF